MTTPLHTIAQLAPVLAMVAIFALIFGGTTLIRRSADRRKGVLMLAMAAVLLGNVLIWTW